MKMSRASTILCAGLALLGLAATVSGNIIIMRKERRSSDPLAEDCNDAPPKIHRDTLRQVTLVMRHGERAPADTYPNDPYVNATMEPFGWGQLTNKGRKNVYRTGEYLRRRYDLFLGKIYNPDIYWLQTTSIDRTKMTGMILSAALWKPNEKQAFIPNIDWQPVSLHYWERTEDRLLIIWNACPRFTMERMQVENAIQVKRFNEDNKELYGQLTNLTGLTMSGPGDVASFYSTLKAETAMDLSLPQWTKEYFPERVEPVACFGLSMNVFTDSMRKLAGGPLVKKILDSMIAKTEGKLKPPDRKMYAYVGHDSTVVNMLSALGVWDGRDPDFGCMIMIELHESNNGSYNVQIFQKNSTTAPLYPLTIPGCETICPLDKFAELMKPVIPGNYDEECKVDDPDYAIPPSPPA